MTMENYIKRSLEGYENFIASVITVQKIHGATGTTLSNSDLK